MLRRHAQGHCIPCPNDSRRLHTHPLTRLKRHNTTEPLAAVTILALEWRSNLVSLDYVEAVPHVSASTASAPMANLPVGFRSLWLHTGFIGIGDAEPSGGAAPAGMAEADEVSGAVDLCYSLGLAPDCYEEFRLFAGAGHPMLTIEVFRPASQDSNDSVSYFFDSLQEVAADMEPVAAAHGLTVSVSSDGTYLRVSRVRH